MNYSSNMAGLDLFITPFRSTQASMAAPAFSLGTAAFELPWIKRNQRSILRINSRFVVRFFRHLRVTVCS